MLALQNNKGNTNIMTMLAVDRLREDMESHLKLMGRPELPACEKKHRLTFTLDFEVIQYLQTSVPNRSQFVNQAVKDLMRKVEKGNKKNNKGNTNIISE